ncbi:MAG: NAD(+) synthase [Spirochaetota bacterium]
MKKIKISSISLKTTPLDLEGNKKKIIAALQDPLSQNSAIVQFPELCITGYGCEDAFYNSHLWKEALQSLNQILPFTMGRIVVVGLPIFRSPYLYNCAAVLCDCKLIGLIPKYNLANTGIHYERRWFQEGTEGVDFYTFQEEKVPFGNCYFQFTDFSLGIEVCEDSWVMQRPSFSHTTVGVDIILSLGASHFALGKHEVRRQIFRESSRSQNNVFVYSNLNGNEAGKVVFDGGCLVAQNGDIVAEGKRYHLKEYEILNAIVDLDLNHHNKAKAFRSLQKTPNSETAQVALDYKISEPMQELSKAKPLLIPSTFEEFTQAVSLGLFDYMTKTRTKGFTVSLSGGADSAACALLVFIMKERMTKELSKESLSKLKLDLDKLLCTIYQGTRNNSPKTKEAAAVLASELGAEHHDIAIDKQVDNIVEVMQGIYKKEITWEEFDIPLQNVQARVRSPNVWFLANVNNHLLLSTGNRSEAAVGYTTMDGDSSGSISPLAGVSKTFVLQWLEYMRQGNFPSLPQSKGLDLILTMKPSAELKPLEQTQEDEKDLMPYPLLQKIEYEFAVNGRNNKEIFEALKDERQEISEIQLMQYIDKFILLFKRNQWKRDRLPPSFHLDEYGLDPKYSYRFPILSS